MSFDNMLAAGPGGPGRARRALYASGRVGRFAVMKRANNKNRCHDTTKARRAWSPPEGTRSGFVASLAPCVPWWGPSRDLVPPASHGPRGAPGRPTHVPPSGHRRRTRPRPAAADPTAAVCVYTPIAAETCREPRPAASSPAITDTRSLTPAIRTPDPWYSAPDTRSLIPTLTPKY